MTERQTTRPQGTQMIDRTVALMRLVATYCPTGVRLTDLAEESGLPAPTARRILKRLVDHGLIAQDAGKHRYSLGRLAAELALSASHVTIEKSHYRPLVEAIGRATGDTVYLLLRSGFDSVCADRYDVDPALCPSTLRIGDRLPLGVGVGGMALLAALPPDETERVIEANQLVYRRFRRAVSSSFRDNVDLARATGQVVRRSPVTPGVIGFGMVLPNRGAIPYAAISGATRAENFAEPRRAEILATMRDLIDRYEPLHS